VIAASEKRIGAAPAYWSLADLNVGGEHWLVGDMQIRLGKQRIVQVLVTVDADERDVADAILASVKAR
jgi:hypothetical protein